MRVLLILLAFITILGSASGISAQTNACREGDTNHDGSISLADYEVWRRIFRGGANPPQPPQVTQPPGQATGDKYGNPWYGVSLDNHEIGENGAGAIASYRFRAEQTSQITGVLYYLISSSSPGYNEGDCGDLEISIQADDGSATHAPTGQALGRHVIAEPCDEGFPKHGFSPAVNVEKGKLYHVVFKNIHPNPSSNWISIDYLYTGEELNPVQRGATNEDFAVLTSNNGGSSWSFDDAGTPILEVFYANGQSQGMGYMEFDWYGGDNYPVLDGTEKVRQKFTVSRPTFRISTINVRVGSGSRDYSGSRLELKLVDSAGAVLATGQVTAYSSPDKWSTYTLPAPVELKNGTTYYLEISALSGQASFVPLSKGRPYDFTSNTFFKDGYMEVNFGNGWEGFRDDGNSSSSNKHDISFYFDVVN